MKNCFQPNFRIGVILALLLHSVLFLQSQTLTSTDNTNDAYIDVSWQLPSSCFNAGGGQPHPQGVYLELKANGVVMYTETIKQIVPAAVTNSFRHFVGPAKNINYSLTLYVVGPGTVIVPCSNLSDAGSTLPFQPPVLVAASDALHPDKVLLSWQNKSNLSSNFQIVRKNGTRERVVATLLGTTTIDTVLTFEDVFRFNDTTSLVNGETYTYCVRTYSDLTKTTYTETTIPNLCDAGSTFDIGLSASDFAFPNRVVLNWNNVAAFADQLTILRNGTVIATLNPTAVTYTDTDPIYGDTSAYEVVIVKEGVSLVSKVDAGGVNPIGVLAGFVRTAEGQGIAGVTVAYTTSIFGVTYADSAVTNYTGAYEFKDLFFGTNATFVLKAFSNNFKTAPDSLSILLNNSNPQVQNANFTSTQIFPIGSDKIEITGFAATPGNDFLTLNWTYTAPPDTTFFQVYREGHLIGITDDVGGNAQQLTDRTGKPNFFYKYEIRAYTFTNDSVSTTAIQDTFQFPAVTAPTNVTATDNFDANSMGVLTVTWQHQSDNFDGFRIYRDSIFLAELKDTSSRNFTDYTGKPGATYTYAVTAFRLLDTAQYESEQVGGSPTAFPDFSEPTNVTATPLPNENAVRVTWNVPSAQLNQDNFTGFKILRNGVEIGEIIKGAPFEFKDLQGIPNANYTYTVQIFVEQLDTVFTSAGAAAAAVNFPAIDPNLGFTLNVISNPGRIRISWGSDYTNTHQNFDGFIILAGNTEVDTLPVGALAYDYYYTYTTIVTVYEVRPYRNINGVIYGANTTNVGVGPPIAANALEAPTNFKASKKYPMHVALSWEYPLYKLSEFVLFRDGVVLDTLPTTVRNYYDNTAQIGTTYEYYIQAIYNNQVSNRIGASGVRRNLAIVQGQVLSQENGRGVNSLEVRLLRGTTVVDRTFTNAAGFYIFENVPVVTPLSVQVQTAGRSNAIAVTTKNITPAPLINQIATVNFDDAFTLPQYPPRPQRDSVAQIIAAKVQSLKNKQAVAFSWATSEGIKEDFNTYRSFTKLTATLTPQFVQDSGGAGGIQYTYPVAALGTLNGELTESTAGVDSIFFPIFASVEQLSATSAYNGNDNTVVLNWSHCTGEVSFYQIERNDQVLGLVKSDELLTWEDTTGKPNQRYTYTVRAVLQKGSQLTYSEPVSVTINYPNVAAPEFTATPVPDSNAVRVAWSYNGNNVNGFRVLRRGELIASLPADARIFWDITGLPDTSYQYTVEAVLEREGMTFFSETVPNTVVFPKIRTVLNLAAVSNSSLGNATVSFQYFARGVDKFEIRYNVGTQTQIVEIPVSDLQNNEIRFIDNRSIPGTTPTYTVRAIATRNNITYNSTPTSVTLTGGYPDPPAATAFSASDGLFENQVQTTWTLPFEANVDGFVVIRYKGQQFYSDGTIITNTTVANNILSFSSIADTFLVAPGKRSIAEVFNAIGDNANARYTYMVAAYRQVNNAFYYSRGIADNGYPGIARKTYNTLALADPIPPNSAFGYSVAMYNNRAVVGAPNVPFSGYAYMYLKNTTTGSWGSELASYGRNLVNSPALKEAGYAVDIHENFTAIGAPTSSSNTTTTPNEGLIAILTGEFTGNYNIVGELYGTYDNERSGTKVAVFGDYAYSARKREFVSYRYDGSSFVWLADHGPTVGILPYVSLDASDQFIAAGVAFESSPYTLDGHLEIFKREGTNITREQIIEGKSGENLGISVAISGDYMAVGADQNYVGSGAVYIYKLNGSGTWERIQRINQPYFPDNSNIDRFGWSVALNGDYLVVGAKGKNRAHLYKRNGNSFELIESLSPTGGGGGAFGEDVAVSDEGILVGAPYYTSTGAVFFYDIDLLQLWHEKLSNVQATDGTLPNQTRVSWEFSGNRSYINGFNIYRDNEKIGSVAATQSFFFDTEGIPGKEYVYTVKVVTNQDRESIGKADKGFRPGEGSIEAVVQTLLGSSPVPGVEITAEGIADGEKYVYKGLTNGDGSVTFNNVIIGTRDTITYTVRAVYGDHEFVQNTVKVKLTKDLKNNRALFFDKTAFVVQGVVQLQNVPCGIDSVRVRAISTFQNASQKIKEAYTDAAGKYTLVIEPNEAGLQSIRIAIDSVHYKTRQGTTTRDTILHQFRPITNPVFTTFNNFPITQTINFLDTLTYSVRLFVTTVCNAPASNGQFNIEVSTKDGCYQRSFRTGTNGRVDAKLPPLDGLIITVKDATPVNITNLLVVDYLRYRPNTLNLFALHLENRTKRYNALTLDSLTFQRLVYHKPPTIRLLTTLDRTFCGSNDLVPVLTQGQPYTFDFSATELHNGVDCQVNEGYLIINNSAAAQNRDTLRYLPNRGVFESHEFIAGEPNLVAPYRKGISVKYFSVNNDFLGELILPLIVEGSAILPGNDIIVDSQDEDGQFKLPLYILRDPPGDGSFSSIAENSTYRKTFTRVESGRATAGLDSDFTFATPLGGAYVKGQITAGGGRTDRNGFDIIATTAQTISTSTAPNFIGTDADVLVGVGVAYQYGLGEELIYDPNNCKMVSIRQFTFTPNNIKTDWIYTVGLLKQFVRELQTQKDRVQAGTEIISEGGRALTQAEAIERLDTRISNWQSVLNYHARTSLPHAMFCSKNPTITLTDNLKRFLIANGRSPQVDNINNNKTKREADAKSARDAFCGQIGTYAGDVFTLNDNVFFDENLKNAYRQAVTKVSYYIDSLTFSYDDVKDKVNSLTLSGSFFPEIENTTFSAGSSITKTATSTTNTLDVIEQRGFFVLDQSIGAASQLKSGTTTGFGVAVDVGLVELKQKLGAVFKASYEGGSNEETFGSNTITYSYTLTDNDPGDQFSVTAIKGQSPGHSPYFQLFGGRSSCPPEPGTILRDQVDLALIDLSTQATFDEQTLNDVSPSTSAKFNLQVTNRSPFGENRDIFLYHDATTNSEGTVLNLSGQRMGGSNESGLTFNFLNPNQPYILPLTLDRAPNKFQFENIRIIARPACADGNTLRDSLGRLMRDTVTISAFFQQPCSPITIASPGDNWVVRRRNPFIAQSRETLTIEIRDYQPTNPLLEEIYLEVRRLGDGSGWRRLPTRELQPPYVVLRDSLVRFNQQNFAPGDVPKFFFVWDLTELYDKYPDGDYEIRAVSFCGASGVVTSNRVRGKISRRTSDIFALTEPSDGVWQRGDEISIRVNKELDCAFVNQMRFYVLDTSTGDTVQGTVGCFYDDNKLVFRPTDMSLYDDKILEAVAFGLRDETGDIFPDTFRWSFKVIQRDIFVTNDTISVRLYRGSRDTLSTNVFANQNVGNLNFNVEENQGWLTVNPTNPVTTNAVLGTRLNFIVNAANLPLGDTSATVIIRSLEAGGGTDTILILVEVVPTPPDWKVDPTKFSDLLPMTVISNWKYNNVPGLSRDTLDLISAWVGNEIRGVTPIVDAGGNFFAAYLAVYGNSPADVGKRVEFRIWDASTGTEYDATPVIDTLNNVRDTIKYLSGSTIGNTQAPKIMVVDPATDRARYIPLNANGWTWFSLNSQERDRSVNRVLRELQNGQSGDIIRTRQKAASFVPGTGWVVSGGLDSLNVIDGYAIYRNGPADSIRVTGRNARYPVIPLDQGWNFVGYPRQDVRGINDILDLLTPTNLDQVFTSRSVLDSNQAAISQYVASSTSWIPSNFNFKPNRAYQIFVGTPTVWLLEGSVVNPLQPDQKKPAEKKLNNSDPALPNTWEVNPADFANSMVVIADLAFDKQLSKDTQDKVGAFVNGECRGVANLQYIPELNKHVATLFVYANRGGEQVEFRLFDAGVNQVYRHTEKLAFANNKVIGNVVQPYHFVNLSLPQGTLTASEVLCAADSSATVRVSSIEGGVPPYRVRWQDGSEALERTNLSAGMYRIQITDQLGQISTDSIEVVNVQRPIPVPTVLVNGDQAICRNTDIWLEAGLDSLTGKYRWYNAAGQFLSESTLFTIPTIQRDTTLFVQANVKGCISPRREVSLKVQAPQADFQVLPGEKVAVGDTVYLQPNAAINAAFAYEWRVGDDFRSRSPEPFHVLTTPGLYHVALKVTDAEGCVTTVARNNYLQVNLATGVENLPVQVLTLLAAPNPFVRQLRATVEATAGGNYLFKLQDIGGRTVWQQTHALLPGKNETLLDVRASGLPEGAYILEVSDPAGQRAVVKLIKRATP